MEQSTRVVIIVRITLIYKSGFLPRRNPGARRKKAPAAVPEMIIQARPPGAPAGGKSPLLGLQRSGYPRFLGSRAMSEEVSHRPPPIRCTSPENESMTALIGGLEPLRRASSRAIPRSFRIQSTAKPKLN